jgi:hypothetical protein
MIVEIDFTNDTILLWSKAIEADYIKYFPAPDSYDPLTHDYIPQTAGVYDANGFFIKPIQTEEEQPIT